MCVHYLKNKVFDFIDAWCNHEVDPLLIYRADKST